MSKIIETHVVKLERYNGPERFTTPAKVYVTDEHEFFIEEGGKLKQMPHYMDEKEHLRIMEILKRNLGQ